MFIICKVLRGALFGGQLKWPKLSTITLGFDAIEIKLDLVFVTIFLNVQFD